MAADETAPKDVAIHREPPYRGRVLVLSPHPDDETIGPGATLALHAQLGDPVSVAFVTSGVHGDASGRYTPEQYVTLRQDEARAAAAVLGLGELEFWGYPDSMNVTDADLEAVADRIVDAWQRHRPEVVYVPHVLEAHSDHHHVARATALARERGGLTGRVLGYEVWSPLPADHVVDVTDVYPTKLAAIACYASQLAETDIVRAVDGLNRFRAILMPHNRPDRACWGEVFEDLS